MQPAAEDPHTRTALGEHQAGAVRWLAGGAIAVALGVLLALGAVAVSRSSGQRIPVAGLVVLFLVIFGAAAMVAGLGALLRTRRWRRALSATPWQTGRLRIAGPAIVAFEPEGYDELDPACEQVRLRLLSTAIWRTRAVQRLDGGEVRAAPVGHGQWVFTAEGVPTLFGARSAGPRR